MTTLIEPSIEPSLETSKQTINTLLHQAQLPGCRVYFKAEDYQIDVQEIIPLSAKDLPVSPFIKHNALHIQSLNFHKNHKVLVSNLSAFTQLYIEKQLEEKEQDTPVHGYLEINTSDIVHIVAKREIKQYEAIEWTENFRLGPIA